ncbi:MAG TPA: hypothetical protein VNX01_02565 [Bacteroidia bacterium]|jgi:hypothetical protein|nr:hypothetical protein [Bacteroidia bacterium]
MKANIIMIAALAYILCCCGSSKAESDTKDKVAVDSSAQKSTTTQQNLTDDWSGTYVDTYGRELTLSKASDKGEIKYSLNMASENCQEVFEGSAFLYSSDGATYTDDNTKCSVTIVQDGDGVTITEGKDCMIHGARCGTSDGHYKKK